MKARDNPFSTDRVLAVRYKPQGFTWAQLLDRLEGFGYRGAIVGPEGSGKTTLLEDLEPLLAARGFAVHAVRLDRDRRWLHPTDLQRLRQQLRPNTVVLLDGLEQLSAFRWRKFRRLTRGAGGLIATSHRAFRLPVVVRTQTSLPLLETLVAELLPGGGAPGLPEAFARHRGNLREVLRELYDRAGDPSEPARPISGLANDRALFPLSTGGPTATMRT